MTGSAFFGEPPNTQNDWYVIRGYGRLLSIPDDVYDPSQGLPIPFQRPQGIHYKSRGPGMIAGAAVAMAMVILLTGTRLWLRIFRRDLKVGLDDFAIVPAALFTLGWLAFVIAQGVYGGVGKHVWDQTYQEVYWNFRLGTIGTVWFWVAVCAIKTSIVLFNRRLTNLTSRLWMIAHYSFLTVIICFLIAAIFSSLFRCTGPVENTFSVIALGRNPPTKRKCLDQNKLGYGLAIVHSALDFALLTVPIIVLHQMKRISTGKKIRLGFLFAVGAISCIGSVMRQIIQDHTINSKDQNWDYPHIVSWTIIDIFFGIVAANLPVLNALIPKHWRSADSNGDVPHLSPFKSGGHNSVRLGSPPDIQRPDGTRMEGSVDIPKDTFHEKTERRWDDAFSRHKSLHETDLEGRGRVLDDSSSARSAV